jgi:hypothetical protein
LHAAGFELLSDQALTPLIRNGRGELALSWRDGDDYASKFSLRLTSASGERCGEFSLLRFSNDAPLWLDGHIFVASGFAETLAGAILRVRKQLESYPDWQPLPRFSQAVVPGSVRVQPSWD